MKSFSISADSLLRACSMLYGDVGRFSCSRKRTAFLNVLPAKLHFRLRLKLADSYIPISVVRMCKPHFLAKHLCPHLQCLPGFNSSSSHSAGGLEWENTHLVTILPSLAPFYVRALLGVPLQRCLMLMTKIRMQPLNFQRYSSATTYQFPILRRILKYSWNRIGRR